MHDQKTVLEMIEATNSNFMGDDLTVVGRWRALKEPEAFVLALPPLADPGPSKSASIVSVLIGFFFFFLFFFCHY